MRQQRRFFLPGLPIYVARAPGRLDLMGGNVDYTGGLVFEMTIEEATWAAVQAADDDRVILLNPQMRDYGWEERAEFCLADLEDEAGTRALVNRSPDLRWTAYVAGIFPFLQKRFANPIQTGVRIYLESDVPLNKGVSSSASVEVAAMKAAAGAYGLELSGVELARACQWLENVIAESACGIMDQAVIVLGREKSCLPILCQPCTPFAPVEMPVDLCVWGIDSGVRHAVTGIQYEAARAACFMGYKLICEKEGLDLHVEEADGIARWVDPRWNGYPSEIPPSLFRSRYEQDLPETCRGEEYLRDGRTHIDPFTPVRPETKYPVRAAMRYAVEENHRIKLFAELARGAADGTSEGAFELMGELMVQSHYAYTECGLGAKATDLLVDLVRQEGARNGLYGAKITGGGAGGTVAILGRRGAQPSFQHVVERYEKIQRFRPHIFEGSSNGADHFGVAQIL